MKDLVIVDRCCDGVVRHYLYGARYGCMCRLNSAGDPVKRLWFLIGGMEDETDTDRALRVVKWHKVYGKNTGAVEWFFAN